jgi:MFS family permease
VSATSPFTGRQRTATVLILGTAQTLAWASVYYLPAIVARPLARDLGLAPSWVFAAFSMALVISAVCGPGVGRWIDAHGGRPVLMGSSGVFALGLMILASAQGPVSLFVAWLVLGVGMAAGLYDAAFASLVRLYGDGARKAITGITLIGGFASTVGWPASTLFESAWGWRGACGAWAVLHVVLGLPLNALLPRVLAAVAKAVPNATSESDSNSAASPPVKPAPITAWLLAYVFAASLFVSAAMAAHLPNLLQASGATLAAAVAAGALMGPAQVAARLLEFGVLGRTHPLVSARLAALAHPLGALLLLTFGGPAAVVFVLAHGAGNGILTITRGTLPLALFGRQGYGARQGFLMLPARAGQALAPWLFGLALERFGGQVLWLSGGLACSAAAVLLLMRLPAVAQRD